MLREDNFCASCVCNFTSQFDGTKFMNIARSLLPSLNEADNFIRSGLFIHPSARNIVSSFKCCGSSVIDGSRIEVIELQLNDGVTVDDAFDTSVELICRHILENSCDAAFVSIAPALGKGWRTALVRSPRFCTFEIPQDILHYMVSKALRCYLAKNCGLNEAELNACFGTDLLLADDSLLADKARIIDAALKTVRFCDPAIGNGQLANAFVNMVVAERLALNKFFTHKTERTEEKFLSNMLENSLYATDCDPGAVEVFKLELKLNMNANVDPHVLWGNVLLEDIFEKAGFDIIVCDPPHLKQDYFYFMKKELSKYACDTTNADIYCYYAERSFGLLKKGGCVVLLTSNRWMRSDYGKGLREFLSQKKLVEIIDYGNIPALDGSNISMSLLTAENLASSGDTVKFISTDTETSISNLSGFASENAQSIDPSALSEKRWKLSSNDVRKLLEKLEAETIPLEEYVGKKKVFRGLLTGCNKAFTMDAKKAEELIAKDSKYAEILKPFLSGRNVKRYAKPVVKNYLICIPRGFTDAHRGTQDATDWFVENYFDIALYLSEFQGIAENRRDRGDYWWEMRSFKHYDELAKAKIICPTIVNKISVAMDLDGLYSNDKTSVIAVEDYYLLGLLNSRMMDFWFRQKSGELLNGYFELKPADLSRMPIMKISPTKKLNVKLRDEIADCAKQLQTIYAVGEKQLDADQRIEAKAIERRLNSCVEKLYRLTNAEIKITENF